MLHLQVHFPPQSSLFGCRFDEIATLKTETEISRLNLACLAVGSTNTETKQCENDEIRLNLACLAVGSTC